MVNHLRQRFPEKTRDILDSILRATIKKGIRSAELYEINTEINVEKYIDLMFILGLDFDVSSKTKWAGELLSNKEMPPDERINRIYCLLENKL